MQRIFKSFAVFLFMFVFTGCELDSGENFHFVNLEVASATFPENFTMGETHEILVNYRRPNDCYFFEGFDVLTADENTRNVVAIGSVLTNDDCNSTNDEVEAILYFTVLYNQTYLFRFYSGNDEGDQPIYLEYEIEVVDSSSDQ